MVDASVIPEISFEEELDRFLKQTETNPPRYDGLIVVGSGQAMTAAMLIACCRPRWVEYLLSARVPEFPDAVTALLTPLGYAVPEYQPPIPLQNTSTAEIYTALKIVKARHPDLRAQRVAVDITGGLKTMTVGLAKAAYVLGLETIYIESDYKPVGPNGQSVRVPGTQRIELPPEPYALFGDLQRGEAQRLWQSYDYAGAHRIYTTLAQLPDLPPADRAQYTALATLAQAYAAWDAFDLPTAQAAFAGLLDMALPPPLAVAETRLRAQQAGLEELARLASHPGGAPAAPQLADLQNIMFVEALLGALYTNGLRRAALGRYDMAALMLYRCLESIEQHRLATYGILTSQQHITLYKGYTELGKRNDVLVVGYDLQEIRDRAEARNHSILAHGYRLIPRTEYEAFKQVVDEMLRRFFQITGHDQPAWKATYCFVQPFATE